MPTTPPHVRLPISGPSFAWRNMYGKMSPSDAEFSLSSAAIGPMNDLSGYVPGSSSVRAKFDAEQLAAQPLDEHSRNVAAAVGAHVHDQPFLADLRVVPLDELADAVAPMSGMWM